jgi:outer membrane protein TolC
VGTSRADTHEARTRARAYREDLPSGAQPQRPELPAPPHGLAAEGRGDVEALRLEQEQARVDEQLAGRWFQAPEFQGGWQRVSEANVTAEGWVLGLNWTVPLFDQGQQAKAQTRGRIEATRARLIVATRRAREELRGALEAYSVLRGEAENARALDETAEAATRGAEAAFGAGELDVTGLVSTLEAALTARLAELELYDRALTAHRALERAAGMVLSGEAE